jgi:hypothetical protein
MMPPSQIFIVGISVVLFQTVRFCPSGVGAPTLLNLRDPERTTTSVADVDIQAKGKNPNGHLVEKMTVNFGISSASNTRLTTPPFEKAQRCYTSFFLTHDGWTLLWAAFWVLLLPPYVTQQSDFATNKKMAATSCIEKRTTGCFPTK